MSVPATNADMSAALLEEDRASRARALGPASFIVEAPAGAGKTELLTQRYLRLLEVVDDPEEIVAITFTNKAAAEMKSRVLESLALAASGVRPEAAHKRITFDLARAALAAAQSRGWRLIEEPARLSILTIDSLCAGLARQMPLLSRFGSQPRISDDPERHYREAARRTLALLDEAGEEAGPAVVAEALRHLDNDGGRLAALLVAMLGRRDQWLRHTLAHGPCEGSELALAALVGRDLERASAALPARLQALMMAAARYACSNLPGDAPVAALADWQEPLEPTPEELPRWRGLAELLLTGKNSLRKKLTVKDGFPPGKDSEPFKKSLQEVLAELAGMPGAEAAIACIRRLPEPRYGIEEWRIVDALASLLKLTAASLWTVFNEAGEADFVEVAQRALLALGTDDAPSDLALSLDYRISHLLVDEFQDTSPTQVRLLERLTAGWQPDDGRTLFAVGDPMQSIYRFRKADVGLFLRSSEVGIGSVRLQRLRLCRNNRSCQAVVDWVNAGFARVFPLEDNATAGAIRYRPFVATRAELPGAAVHIHPLVLPRELASEEADRLEARTVLAIIAEERAAEPQRQIAVLVRARNHLAALVTEIRRHRPELSFRAVEIERLGERQPVQDLLSLTRALHHRADRVAWLAILRAPWCGLTLADLHALAADDHESTIWQLLQDEARLDRLSEDGSGRLVHVRAVLEEALAHQGRSRLRRWVEGTWLKLGGAACLVTPAEVADAKAFLDLLDELDAAGRFQLDRLEDEVDALYAAPDAQADGMLQFMTIHKAKGLEFDTVILPGLHRKSPNDGHELMLWEEVALEGLSEQLVVAPFTRRARDGAPTPYDYLRLLEQERSGNEAARVLYVAATRAVRSLHLVGVARSNAEGEAIKPAGSFLDLLWSTVAGDFAAVAEQVEAEPEPAAASRRFVPRLVRTAAPVAADILHRRPPAAPAAQAAIDRDEPGSRSLEASVGTLVHAYLEIIAREGTAAWPVERVRSLAAAMTLWLSRRGHDATEAKAGAARAEACLVATLASRDGRWVLTQREGGAIELALAAPGQDAIATRTSTHIVDRSFVEDGTRWIIDYKSARLDGNDAELAAHAERYRPQLERYAALFADEGLPLKLAIFYAAIGRLVELPAVVS
ncbi:ATP-dependent helicase/nuclease subunit A [mine drainage metagenome]|uniref:DNA 3'-5' helicase n=1 Tax=mine drainage metagenome TaxID=410659 RepID=A0A1J5SZN7_9ZZZZ